MPVAGTCTAAAVRRIGALILGNADAEAFQKELRQGLSKAGYLEERKVRFDIRSAQGRIDQLPKLAAELVNLKGDVIIAVYALCSCGQTGDQRNSNCDVGG